MQNAPPIEVRIAMTGTKLQRPIVSIECVSVAFHLEEEVGAIEMDRRGVGRAARGFIEITKRAAVIAGALLYGRVETAGMLARAGVALSGAHTR